MLKLKLIATVLAVAFAASASAGWRAMRVEAANAANFDESVAAFEEELSPARQYVLMLALRDIWAQGLQRANAEQRDYSEVEYFRELDGLTYDEVVTLADPTGKITKERYRAGVRKMLTTRGEMSTASPPRDQGTPVGGPGGQYRGGRGY